MSLGLASVRYLRHAEALVLLLLITQMFVVGLISSNALQADREISNIVLISWDGVRRERLYELMAKHELENLRALISEGRIVNMTIEGHQTDTLAGHAEMLTGYGSFLTGVRSDDDFGVIPKGYTIFERLEAYFGTDNVITIMVTGKSKLGAYEGSPFSNAARVMDALDSGEVNASLVVQKVINHIEDFGSRRFFAFIHFSEPDIEGHNFGENSKEYEDAIRINDFWLGSIVAKLKDLGIYDRTGVYVTTDHGFNKNAFAHSFAPNIFLATNDRGIMHEGSQGDIVPTLLNRLKIHPCLVSIIQLTPPLPGRSLTDSLSIPCTVIVGGAVIGIMALAIIYVRRWRRQVSPLRHIDVLALVVLCRRQILGEA